MQQQTAGFQWLKEHLNLQYFKLTHISFIGSRNKIEIGIDNVVEETFGAKYAPAEDGILPHIEFGLKYDDFSLDFLNAVFKQTDEEEIIQYIKKNPTGKYSRKIGFLFEWLTGESLDLDFSISGNYVDFLDPEKYITGSVNKNSKWRINDNLLGGKDFCPVVRNTHQLEELLNVDYTGEIENLKSEYSVEVFNRATQYLYRKETKSSYEIESEKPTPDRMNRFVNLLYEAGRKSAKETLSEETLTNLQNAIVDPRYKQEGYRKFQNYIGQTNYRLEEIYHYVCPPPVWVHPMMNGLLNSEEKTKSLSPIVRAAIVSFGFVFIHPFLDGNGRIHRFLIHDFLARDGFVEKGIILPVSAHMLNNMAEYDTVLESYSVPLMKRIQFSKDEEGELIINNIEEVECYYKYPDLTLQTSFLAKTINETIKQDLNDELLFLERYDELKREILQLIDMPDQRVNEIIVFLHQNKGIFPKRRKKNFPEIIEEEFSKIEDIYRVIFS